MWSCDGRGRGGWGWGWSWRVELRGSNMFFLAFVQARVGGRGIVEVDNSSTWDGL